MCVCECVCENEKESTTGCVVVLVARCSAPSAHQPFCLCSSLCQCVQVFPFASYIRSSKQKRERERTGDEEEEEEADGLFPQQKTTKKQNKWWGRKTQMRKKDTFEKRIFFSSVGVTKKSVHF